MLARLQAQEAYLTELSKWAASDRKNDELIKASDDLKVRSQATAFESQLARSLRKEDEKAKAEGIVKYCTLYAGVPRDMLAVQLMDESDKILKKKSTE